MPCHACMECWRSVNAAFILGSSGSRLRARSGFEPVFALNVESVSRNVVLSLGTRCVNYQPNC